MGAKKKPVITTRPGALRPAGIQTLTPDVYAQIKAALQELAGAH